mmetsp:Transcript_15716/g.48870  ORF Transcript_15716/g.48870 Transcript_15716/m.48870 type:complete len:298 (-) Transcript_15716:1613-2506(-)
MAACGTDNATFFCHPRSLDRVICAHLVAADVAVDGTRGSKTTLQLDRPTHGEAGKGAQAHFSARKRLWPIHQPRHLRVAVGVERDHLPPARGDMLDGEAKLFVQILCRGRRTKAFHADDGVGVFAPALDGRGLDGNHRHAAREDALPVLHRLLVKELPAWHRDDTHTHRLLVHQLSHLHGQANLRAGRDEAEVKRGGVVDGRLVQRVPAKRDALDRRARVVGHRLAGERNYRRARAVEQRDAVRARDLVRVARAEGEHVWHRAEGEEHLDGLVRRPVLAKPDRIVRHHVEHAVLGDG